MTDLKIGKIVRCPADRGDLPYEGKVTWIGTEVNYNHLGVPYVWVGVNRGLYNEGWSATWPSNRLGYKVTLPPTPAPENSIIETPEVCHD